MQAASVISSALRQFMVLGWVFQKGRLFSSLTLASSSDARSEGAILWSFLITCPRLLFVRTMAAWQAPKSTRAKVAILKGEKNYDLSQERLILESLFRERAVLSPYLLRISFAVTSKRISKWAGDQKSIGEQLSLLCCVCPMRGKSDGSWWTLVLRSILSMFARTGSWLYAAIRQARLLGWVNDLLNSYTCFRITNTSCLTFYTSYSKSSQDGQEEQPNFCDWSRINTLNAW